ncbi:MAG: GGDEF domain-containing protein [Actinomycetota bacterium]|nr:GGDEF domain-containing protein [Actinomycetota bacterium]
MSIRGVLIFVFGVLSVLGLVALGLAVGILYRPAAEVVLSDLRIDTLVELPWGAPVAGFVVIPVDDVVDRLTEILIGVLGLLVLLLVLAPWLVYRWAVRPIPRLNAQLHAVTVFPGNPPAPDPRRAYELVDLADTIELARQALLARDHDIEQLTTRLAKDTTKDPLTNLADRRFAYEFLKRELQRSRRNGLPCSILMVDIDNFRAFNEEWWRAAGDEALAELATKIQGFVRSTDLVARWGGDEMIVILVDTDREGAVHVGEAIRSKLRESQQQRAKTLTVSIGVTTSYPMQDASVEAAYGRAEAAAAYAKERGGDRVEFRP